MRRNLLGGLQIASLLCCLGAAPLAGAAGPSLQTRLQQLEDRAAIQQLLERYVEVNEARDFATYAQLFARDGELVIGTLRKKGPAEIRDFLTGAFTGAGASRGPKPGSSHLLTNVRIQVDGDKATGISRWTLVGPVDGKWLVASKGTYVDKFVREDGHWKFQERSIVTDAVPAPPEPGK